MHRAVEVFLKVPEVEIKKLMVVDDGSLNLVVDMFNVIIYLGDLWKMPLM